jgi:CheY-like chemotaxis protein
VLADPGQVEEVLLNLALNAGDAMPRGGLLTVDVANAALDGEASARAGVKPGRYVSIAVRDTGMGMSPEVQAHVFEPFFTTKGPGKGTGLGLSTSYGIIRQNDGNIHVSSETGKGTEFTIWLPAAPEGSAERMAEMPQRVSLAGSQTILVCEGEPDVRAVLNAMLTHAGYRVLACSTPDETVRTAEGHGGEIDLLISELRPARADGPPLVDKVKRMRPNIAVLYVSGQNADASRPPPGGHILSKPFTPETLSLRVTEALSRAVHSRADGGAF